jgi:uncharacterized RDD family membrane protein YckC
MDPYKALGRRIVALIIDGLILTAIFAVLYFPFAEKQSEILENLDVGESASTYVNVGDYSLTGSKAGLFFLAMIVIQVLYWVVLVGLTGRTVGKALTGVKVVRENDLSQPPGMGRAFLRHLLWIVDEFPYLIPGLTGFIVAMTNPRRRRVGDIAAGTVVVQTNQLGDEPAQPDSPFGTPYEATPVQAAEPPKMGTAAMPAIQVPKPEPPPLPVPPSGPPADWYPDPHGQKRLRYWDGASWTDHTAD